MLDRFKDAQWMVEKRELHVDGGDTSPGSHGSVTHLVWDTASPDDWTNVIAHIVEDRIPGIAEANARLIALAPTLLRIVKTLLASWECDPDEDAQYEDLMDKAIDEAREAIAKAEGWLVCQDGQHRCFNTDQPCGCRCGDCRDDTEPRCDICNGLINKYGSAIGHCENESDHSGRVHQDPRLRFGPPLDTCTDCMEEEASDHTNTRIQVGCGYIIVDREECQNMRHVEEGE